MPSRLWFHRLFTASGVALLSVACSRETPVEQPSFPNSPTGVPPAELVVSDPFLPTQASASAAQVGSDRSSISVAQAEVAYVSLPAGSLPKAISVTIRNLSAGGAATPLNAVLDGGFDPIGVAATAGDDIELRITSVDGAITVYRTMVPKRSPPRVVRTSPPKGMVDVPLNTRVLVVFTEPIAPATLTTATIRLLQGATDVRGTVRLVAGSLFEAEFVPDEELISGTTYRLVVSQDILDADGDRLDAEVATDFTTLMTGVVTPTAIVAGFGHTCALRPDGALLCWGENTFGQLGAGNNLLGIGTCPAGNSGSVLLCSTEPVPVFGDHTFASLASGFEHTCALTAGGKAFCWGSSGKYPGGEDWPPSCDPSHQDCNCDSSTEQCNGVPVQVDGDLQFRSLAGGYYHTCGIEMGGGAYCWGNELFRGLLGTGGAGVTASPTAVLGGVTFISLASGAHHICGLDTQGAAYCWGLNLAGQLGIGGSSPDICQVDPNFVWRCAKAPALVGGGLTFVSLTAGWQHTCGLTPTGRAYCWGDYLFAGSYGASPASVSESLTFVSLSSGASASHTCGVTSANAVYCWGRNDFGQLGDGSTNSTLVPVRVSGGIVFSAVAVGDEHSCGITLTREVYCWGTNRTGQLGISNTASGSLVPIRVAGH
jgi:alpha-tubulin suppressor-like RCC1 family protein